jgi:hypothetical protein
LLLFFIFFEVVTLVLLSLIELLSIFEFIIFSVSKSDFSCWVFSSFSFKIELESLGDSIFFNALLQILGFIFCLEGCSGFFSFIIILLLFVDESFCGPFFFFFFLELILSILSILSISFSFCFSIFCRFILILRTKKYPAENSGA